MKDHPMDRLIVIDDEAAFGEFVGKVATSAGFAATVTGNVMLTGRRSPMSLYNQELVTFEADQVYNQRAAELPRPDFGVGGETSAHVP